MNQGQAEAAGTDQADWRQIFFRPRNVVMIGASERSPWSGMVSRRFATYEHAGKVYGVNPTAAPAHGLPVYTSCREIPDRVDLAYVMVRAELVADALADAAAAGIRHAVVLSSGFAEAGEEGAELQRQLVARCKALGVRMLGPNSLGFANMREHLVATSIPARRPLCIGHVGVVSQSGSIAADISRMCHQQNIGMSFLCAPGNAAMIDALDAIEYMIGDPETKIILVYAESAFDADRFKDLTTRAMRARKPIIIHKVGRSELSAAVAQAHTGSVVGNDRVFDAICHQHGAIRVNSVEELVTTGGLLEASGPLEPGKGIAFISVSGGAAAMFADLAEENGVPVPAFSPETVATLQSVVPAYASVSNPFDITGGALSQPAIWAQAIPAILNDPAIGFAFTLMGVPATEDETLAQRSGYEKIAEGFRIAGRDAVIVGQMVQPVGPFTQQFMAETGCRYVFCGLELVAKALGHLYRWSSAVSKGPPEPVATPRPVALQDFPRGERATLEYLSSRGVPVVPGKIAASEAEAVAAAAAIGGPAALKIASPDVAHKTELGGVALAVEGTQNVKDAYHAILDKVSQACPDARIDGVLVSPMRTGGIELFVGIARDPDWGPILALGMGGIWMEILDDTALRPLPVSQANVVEMLGELRASKLLDGYRGGAPVDFERLADVIVAIGNAALALGQSLASLEVNPLLVNGSSIEALDALAVRTAAVG